TGEQSLEYVAAHDVDLILMDVEMPGMNGVTATKAIREFKKNDWFPIVFLTAKVDDESFTDGILAGGDAYLTKPLNPLRLQLTVIAMERIYHMRQILQKTKHELELANVELERLSLSDQLTGLGNRRNFDLSLDRYFQLAKRNKSPLSLIVCDIDYFKAYNDKYGHPAGDNCLREVSQEINRQVKRSADLVCRYGGEEFTVLLPDTGLMGATHVAELIRSSVAGKKILHQASAVEGNVTISLGVSTYTGQYKTAGELTKAADEALYSAKGQGRNRIETALSVTQ
ncbi:MAG: diguanylate cyclase, partial [Methylomonas sp.]